MLLPARAGIAAALSLTLTVASGSAPAFADHFRPSGATIAGTARIFPRPTGVTTTSPLRIVAAAGPQVDVTGTTWLPDGNYAHGGALTSTTQPIARTGS